jgi:protochlorophyllide reductase
LLDPSPETPTLLGAEPYCLLPVYPYIPDVSHVFVHERHNTCYIDLGALEGLEQGGKNPIAMIDGKAFNGAKAYKDSKICNMMTVNELHNRYHKSTGVIFNSMYPGCIAETQLFREKRVWFRKLFPLFMRYVTGGYVGEKEAGERLAQVVDGVECSKSGVYWSWNGGARQVPVKDFKKGFIQGTGGSGGELFENTPSDAVKDEVKSKKMFELSTKVTGAKWL